MYSRFGIKGQPYDVFMRSVRPEAAVAPQPYLLPGQPILNTAHQRDAKAPRFFHAKIKKGERYLRTQTIKLADIKPAEYNPRVTLTEKDQEYKALRPALRTTAWSFLWW